MGAPHRVGIGEGEWARLTAPLDRAREEELARAHDLQNIEGVAVVWYRRRGTRALQAGRLVIQPGVADDLPSLLSALAREVAWPGVGDASLPMQGPGGPAIHAESAVAAWARAWQVREQADLRVAFHWDEAGTFHGIAELRFRTGAPQRLLGADELVVQLDARAAVPMASESPHGLILAGNRAMQAKDAALARSLYERALSDLPGHVELRRNLALALARLGAWEEAAGQMRAAWELAPGDEALAAEYIAVETDAGIHAVQAGALEEGAGHFLCILAVRPDEPTALANLGNLRLREGRVPEARAIFRRFLHHHPNHAAAGTIRLALAELGDETGA